jgi:ankyrin repeat protein
VERLLKAGADPNTATQEGETPLMTASRSGSVETVKMLLDHGADLKAQEAWRGQTPLMWAAAESHPGVISLLIQRGADVNAKSAVFDFTQLKAKAGSVPMNFPRGGFTALLFAARQGDLESSQMLLTAGANVNLPDPDGTTPLLAAIINFHFDTALFLLNHGADPNPADAKGRAPLYAAVDMHSLDTSTRPNTRVNDKADAFDVIKALLAKGANPNAALTGVIPPRGVLDGADRTMGPGATPFMRAAKSNDIPVMTALLEKGADPTLATSTHANALMFAAGVGWRDGKSHGVEEDALQAMQICLDRGVSINAADDQGNTALHGAASRGADQVIAFLAAHGADVNAKDKKGRTALDVAMGVGAEAGGVRAPHESTVSLLKQLMSKAGVGTTAALQ